MKRSMCGMALLAAATALWSCNGDPTGSIRDSGHKVLADPTSVFVDQGANEFVTVELVDGQGNQLETEFTPQNVGAGITVVEDTTFLQTSTGHIQTQQRFIVTGVTPSSASFDLVSGGDLITVPVRVLPISFAPTFSNAAPVQNEAITITAPEGFAFASNAIISFGADTAVVVSRATDGTSFTFVPVPAFVAGTFVGTVSGALSDLFNTVPLSIPTADSVAIPGIAVVPGTGAPGSAPNLNGPAAGTSSVIFDAGTFTAPDITGDGGLGAQYYKVTITEAGDYKFITNWVGNAIAPDMDGVLCFDTGCAVGVSAGITSGQPETGIITLVPGTYYLGVVLFDGIAPPRISVQIDRL